MSRYISPDTGKRLRRWNTAVIVMAVLTVLLAGAMLCCGNMFYAPSVVFRVLRGEMISSASYAVLRLRLPRMLAAVFSGMAFGMAGFVFQTVLRNPLASPDVIGISTSTSAAAVFCISLLGLQGIVVPAVSVLTGLIVSIVIYLLAARNGFSHVRMILIGIGVQAMLGAVISWVLSRTSEYDVANTMRWMNGSLTNARMQESLTVMVIALTGCLFLLVHREAMRLIELGDAYAETLGGNIRHLYPKVIAAAVLLVAFATAAVGPVSSVSFLAGPIASRLSGRSRSTLIPSALAGSVLVLAADLIGQFLLPARYPAGVITGLLGGPYLLYLLVTINRKGETG